MFNRRPTNREALLSDADHYAEAARAQRRRAAQAGTAGLKHECLTRAAYYEDRARKCRQAAKADKLKPSSGRHSSDLLNDSIFW